MVVLVALLALACDAPSQTAPATQSPALPIFDVLLDRGVVVTVSDQSGLLVGAHPSPLTQQELLDFVTSGSAAGRAELRDSNLIVAWLGGQCDKRPMLAVRQEAAAVGVDVFDGLPPPGVDICSQVGVPLGVSLEFAEPPAPYEIRRHQGTP